MEISFFFSDIFKLNLAFLYNMDSKNFLMSSSFKAIDNYSKQYWIDSNKLWSSHLKASSNMISQPPPPSGF